MSCYLWPILTPLPCHTLSHISGPPKSTSHISDPPIFSRPSTKNPDKAPCTNSLSIAGIIFRIGAMVWRCILGLAPAYLRDLCHPTPGTRGCSSLRSSEQGLLFVPFARTSTTKTRAFSVVGPSVWNGLPLSQRLLPRILSDTFYSSLDRKS